MKKRIQALRQYLTTEKVPALLVTNPYNVRYMTGFTGTTGIALITVHSAYFITDFRYIEQAKEQCPEYEIVRNEGPIFEEILPLLNKEELGVLGFDDTHLSFAQYMELEDLLWDIDLVPVHGWIEKLREVKDEREIATIQEACRIADAAFDHILGFIQPGMTEIEVANELDFYMRRQGASGVSFDTIVASGLRSALPHGVASHKVIEKGDFITLDFGCYYNGYVSDMTRTISLGEPREAILKEIYDIVLQAHLLVEEKMKPGMEARQIDAIARDYITAQGYGKEFGHSTGHGIGLEIHEAPLISSRNDQIVVANNTITDEPGIYLAGIGGVRIENDFLMTAEGCQSLTKSPRDLIIL